MGEHAQSTPAVAQDLIAEARRAVAANASWYHTLELAPGVVTPGMIDLREVAAKILPADLRGRRALDIGTFDGFWAFELERRGAEVVAIDVADVGAVQLPPNNRQRLERAAQDLEIELARGFRLAAELLGSRVQHAVCDVTELLPERIGGPVEVAFMGALLLHVRDPVRALERILGALAPGGQLFQLESISLPLTIMHPRRPTAYFQTLETNFNWWQANRAALRAWLLTAGFEQVRGHGIHRPPQRSPMGDRYWGISSRRPF